MRLPTSGLGKRREDETGGSSVGPGAPIPKDAAGVGRASMCVEDRPMMDTVIRGLTLVVLGAGALVLTGCSGGAFVERDHPVRIDVLPTSEGPLVMARNPVPIVLGAGDSMGNLMYAYYLAQQGERPTVTVEASNDAF